MDFCGCPKLQKIHFFDNTMEQTRFDLPLQVPESGEEAPTVFVDTTPLETKSQGISQKVLILVDGKFLTVY